MSIVNFHPLPYGGTGAGPVLPPVGAFTPNGSMFYALMPGDNAGTVAVGGDVDFPQAGASYGPNPPVALGVDSFSVPTEGTYLISWQVSVTEAGQLQLVRGLAGVTIAPETTAGRATGTSQISNTVLLTLVANEIIRVRNPAGNAAALTITPIAGGASSVGATLTIIRVA